MDPPLPARLPAEMLHGVGDIDRVTDYPRRGESAVEDVARRTDERVPLDVLLVARLLAEMIVLTVLLGTSLKFEGKFIAQTQTDGPVDLLVVDFTMPSSVRAYARFDAREDGYSKVVLKP